MLSQALQNYHLHDGHALTRYMYMSLYYIIDLSFPLFTQYITKSFSHLEKAEAFKFRFNDDNETSPDSSIVLNFPMEEIVINGWYVQPYSWPCEVGPTCIYCFSDIV